MPNIVTAATAEKLLERLKTEGYEHWKILDKYFENSHCIWTEENDQYKDKKEIFRYELYNQAGQFFFKKERIKETNKADDSYETIACSNIKYSFEILKRKQSQNGWRINFCGLTGNNAILDEQESTVSTVKSSYSIFGRSLNELIQSNDFVITNITEENINSCNTFVLDFSFQSSDLQKGIFADIKKGKVYLVPERHWTISKVYLELERKEQNGLSRFQNIIDISYLDSDREIPQIQQVVFSLLKSKKPAVSWISKFEKIDSSNNKLPPSIFTLSHYGLPEPDFDNSRRTSANRVRYILMGLMTIIIVIALWRIIQKRRRKM
jgi:hypothetical protein